MKGVRLRGLDAQQRQKATTIATDPHVANTSAAWREHLAACGRCNDQETSGVHRR